MSSEGRDPIPELDGVEHRFITTPDGIDIHVALAGPEDGPPLMLVHGFPQHWWEWRHQIGPLAAQGVRVIVPDTRGTGWSDAPSGKYFKSDLADDLAEVIKELNCGPVKLAAHDWGGPIAYCLLANHPDMVSAFMGFNTVAPVTGTDPAALRHGWSFWYQLVLMAPFFGPRVLASHKRRFMKLLVRWVGGGYDWSVEEYDIFLDRFRQPDRAEAGSQYYRTFQLNEMIPWMKGQYKKPVDIPLRWVTGLDDPVVTPTLLRSHVDLSADIDFEEIPGIGHYLLEQAPELGLERLQDLMRL